MAGLLYKDFIGIKGKRIVGILAGCTVLFLIVRFVFPGNVTTAPAGGMAESETGVLRDFLLATLPMLLVVCGIMLPSTWTAAICRNDEKNKTKQFTGALPLDKNAYIASKYIFIGIAVYVLFSLETTWIIIFNSVAGDNFSREILAYISSLLAAFSGISLLLAAIELPFFLTLGVKKGYLLKTAILEGIALLATAYLLFGNLKIFDNFNIYVFVNWCEEHLVIVMLISIVSPVADILIFWLSYRLTCRINQNREVEIDG
ncbi:MAG: ABC-2 transporter permease [Lachnospiraceae bacterium]|nr:ABC-2 transporter permease [Lachnospiraceae bacterium]